jgi:membrane-bound inhibitor of C-type lysozyme
MQTRRISPDRGLCLSLGILILAGVALTAGCAPRVGYVCDNGSTLNVTFREHQHKIEVDTGTGIFDLQSVPASSGTRYADEERTFWFKGDELSITVNDRPIFGQCRKIAGTSN